MGPRPARSPPERDGPQIRELHQSIQRESIPTSAFCYQEKKTAGDAAPRLCVEAIKGGSIRPIRLT